MLSTSIALALHGQKDDVIDNLFRRVVDYKNLMKGSVNGKGYNK